ncbi:bacteriophage protein [Serratia marcescens]|uniref:baseplate J/gp47 family protein n=1 Tax=Serratia marcescens TaxID=615 RepID=UPI00062C92E8|nr:baseplate J/gp47 family protein [Serratia marcescens]KKZ19038.1 bacteriophage protein [Serratia marcescens]
MLNLDTLGLSATVTPQGISAPDYQTILDKLTGYFQQIYGQDVYLASDSKDGQLLALFAQAISDTNDAIIAAYNSFSPATSGGGALSSNVKINGITREPTTRSTVDLVLTGQVGITITNGSARDANNVTWNLPAMVTLDVHGQALVTALCAVEGAVVAAPGTITTMNTPTRGWQSVNNPGSAAVGQPVETDSQLRARQQQSVALPSRTVLSGIVGAVATLDDVVRYRGCENDTGVPDANGLPPHSISLVVDGGDAAAIAATISLKKTPGAATYGTTTEIVADDYGIPHPINFFRPTEVEVYVHIQLKALLGYTAATGDRIKQRVVDYINALGIGETVYLTRLYLPANLAGEDGGETFDLLSLTMGTSAGSVSGANIAIAFNAAAHSTLANITVEVS